MQRDVRTTPYEDLLQQWKPLIYKFSRWNIGVDPDDLYQELSIILYAAQQRYDPSRGASFGTYLYRALITRVRKLYQQVNKRKKRVPPSCIVPLEKHHENILNATDEQLELVELLANVTDDAKSVARCILAGAEKPRDQLLLGLSNKQINQGTTELRRLLR